MDKRNMPPPLPFPLTTLPSIIFTTGPLIVLWSLGNRYITRSYPLRILTIITLFSNLLSSLISALLAYSLLTNYLHPTHPLTLTIPILGRTALTSSALGYIYHLSQFYSYIDILTLVLSHRPVSAFMAFHHLTFPYLTYFRVMAAPSSTASADFSLIATPKIDFVDDWRVFALASCVHQTILHLHSTGVAPFLKATVPVTGYLQLLLAVTVDAHWMWITQLGRMGMADDVEVKKVMSSEATSRGVCFLLTARYGIMFARELRAENEKMEATTVEVKVQGEEDEAKEENGKKA